MGMTRRLNHYDNPDWHPFMIVAAAGAVVILCGIVFQLVQLVVSIVQREKTRDLTGDPWNARTLEWAIPSPPPAYNFAEIPIMTGRDAFWEMKKNGSGRRAGRFQRIDMPRNTSAGLLIGGFSLVLGFALVWHIWWMAAAGAVGIVATAIAYSFKLNREYFLSALDVERSEKRLSPATA
jgi:cytochrome o ubiquinol oxidase subunit 1